MTDYVYRYRPIKAVLNGYHELEYQEIYFSRPDELNDPMEGFKDIFWQGDEIVWRNFLKHYILCVLEAGGTWLFAAGKFEEDIRNILNGIVFHTPQDLPEAPIRESYHRILEEFMAAPVVQRFLSLMGARDIPVRRNELINYLEAVHIFATEIVLKEFKNCGFLGTRENAEDPLSREATAQHVMTMMESVAEIVSTTDKKDQIPERLFSAMERTRDQVRLINEYQLLRSDGRLPLVYWASRFPAIYVTAIEKLIHRDWYVACFAKKAEDHSMWSTYADGHRGVCLMFKTTADANGMLNLTIERVTSVSGSRNGPTTYHSTGVLHELQAVRYTAQYPEIDFFRSLGSISEKNLNDFWYRGEEGTLSVCREAVYADQETWRTNYWKTYGESALYKTPEWQREEEYRIVAHSGFDMTQKDARKLKYRFQDLAGIVFGVRTSIDDKLEIMRIIDEKCALSNRSDFRFFEIRYLDKESRFQIVPLDLLKVKHGKHAIRYCSGQGDVV